MPGETIRGMDAYKLQLGDKVIVNERYRYYRPVCTVVAIQRRRHRAEIEWPRDGKRSWHPTRVLELA